MGAARPEGVAEEVEADVLRISSAVRVFAVHDLGLLGAQFEAQGPEPLGDSSPQWSGLKLSGAVDNHVIRIAFEGTAGEFPVYPPIERVVHEQVGQQGRDR